MALCSQVFNASSKRTCSQIADSPAKKICLSNVKHRTPSVAFSRSVATYTSSESDEDSDDEQSCYHNDQIKARRRALTRVSFSMNPNKELLRAISQYSDDEDVSSEASHDNIDCKLSSSPMSSFKFASNCSNLLNQHRQSFLQISDPGSSQPLKKSIPESDKQLRARCFEYLVGSIDEAWARYCDATTYVEDEVYGYNTPASVATDDEDYFGNTTDITDYESDIEVKPQRGTHRGSRSLYTPISPGYATPKSECGSSKDPSSCQLQALKDRLTKAKYFLQDLVDSDDINDANAFWKRWDMIKYATIELVEDDDDDEVIESTIEELEDGRLFSN